MLIPFIPIFGQWECNTERSISGLKKNTFGSILRLVFPFFLFLKQQILQKKFLRKKSIIFKILEKFYHISKTTGVSGKINEENVTKTICRVTNSHSLLWIVLYRTKLYILTYNILMVILMDSLAIARIHFFLHWTVCVCARYILIS